jgi:hypothetical protein
MTYNRKLLQGVGINDAKYAVKLSQVVDGVRKKLWVCPYYSRWEGMLQRCYSPKYLERRPTYKGCRVCEEWLTFSNFKAWMEIQDWEGKHLDKDILVDGNKIYSPETCVFILPIINSFILDSSGVRGKLPLGVSINENCIRSRCSDPFKIRGYHIGYFKTPEEAYQAWRERKHQYAVELANSEYVTDERVKKVLLTKYL